MSANEAQKPSCAGRLDGEVRPVPKAAQLYAALMLGVKTAEDAKELLSIIWNDAQSCAKRNPLHEVEIVAALVKAGCLGTVKMSFDSGPYDLTRTSINAERFVREIERAHGIGLPNEK